MTTAFRLYFDVFKLRIGLVIGITAVFGWVVRVGNLQPAGTLAALFASVVALSAAAGAYNQISERELDARMGRTRRRPFATGRLHAGVGWYLGIAAVALGGLLIGLIWCSSLSALFSLAGAFTYAVVYTRWLKRRTVWNIVIGGLAGSFAVLAGSAAAAGDIHAPRILAFALVLFLWTPPHFWSLALAFRDDYAEAGVPMLPVVVGDQRAVRIIFYSALALVLAGLVPAWCGLGAAYAGAATVLGLMFLRSSWRLWRDPSRAMARANFRASLVYLAGIMLSAVLDVALRA